MEKSMDQDVVMSDFTASQLGYQSMFAQLPGNDPYLGSTTDHRNLPRPYVATATKLRPILGSEWPQFERVLQHIYIEKDQSLKAAQRYLREKHGLVVTEKQLTRRFATWNFKKNVKTRERKALLEELKLNEGKLVNLEGRGKITAKKMVRWEKEEAILSKPGYQLHLHEESHNLKDMPGWMMKLNSEKMELFPTATDTPPTRIDCWDEDPDVLIAQLFAKLDLDLPKDFEWDSVKAENIKDEKPSESDFVSFGDINDNHTSTTIVIRHCDSSQQQNQVWKPNHKTSAFKWVNMDVVFSTGVWIDPSPYNELYPFSPSTSQKQYKVAWSALNSNSQPATYPKDSSIVLEERLKKIERLRHLCSPNHFGLMCEMYEIAAIYYYKRDFAGAEHWFRQIVQSPSSNFPGNEWVEINSWMLLSQVLSYQGKYKEAKRAHEVVHPRILSSTVIQSSLIETALELGGQLALEFEEPSESEAFFRQLAQVRLTTYGPRHHLTIASLHYFAEMVLEQSRYSESEEIFKIMIGLTFKSSTSFITSEKAPFEVFCGFARVLFKQGRLADAEDLFSDLLQHATIAWGSLDHLTLLAETQLARVVKAQGRYKDSEPLLRKSIDNLREVYGERSLHTAKLMVCLAEVLGELGETEEAQMLWEKTLVILEAELGYTYYETWKSCEMLAMCYDRQERYEDELDLFQKSLMIAEKTAELDEAQVDVLRDWLKDAQQKRDEQIQSHRKVDSTTADLVYEDEMDVI